MKNREPTIVRWLRAIAPTFPPVDWLLNSNRISFAQEVDLREEERLTFALAMLLGKKKLIIEMPNPSTRLAAGVAAGLFVSDLIARELHHRRLLIGDMLFVTRHIGVGVQTLAEVSLEKMALTDIWQVKSASEAVPVRGRGTPRLFVSPPSKERLLPNGIRLAAAVVDASHPLTLERLDTLLNDPSVVAADTIVLITPLGYDYSSYTDDSWLRWTWDWETIKQLNGSERVANEEAVKTCWHRTLLVCDDPELDGALGKVRAKLGLLSKHVNHPPGELLRAWGVYHRLTNLAVPLGEFEEAAYHHHYARPVRQTIESLQNSHPSIHASTAGQAIWASEWPSVVELLGEAYECLKGDWPAKLWALAYLLEEHVQTNFQSPLLMIISTDVEASILLRNLRHVQEDLPRYLHPDALSIIRPRAFAEGRDPTFGTSTPVLPGPFTSRWRYLNGAILQASLLAYPHQIGLAQREIETVVGDILSRASEETQLETLLQIRATKEISTKAPMLGDATEEDVDSSVVMEIRVVENIPDRKPLEVDVSMELSPNWAWDEDDVTFVPPLQLGRQESDTLSAIHEGLITLLLSDNTYVITPPDQTFDVFRFVTEELVEVSAAHIEEGDLLVIVDDGNYANLFERSVEALETTNPQYARLSTWLSLWELVKEDALQACNGSYSELHQELTRRDISITEQAVRSWYAEIMAPRDTEAVFAMIDLSGIKAAKSHERQIRDAIGHIRGMRRAIGRRIQRLIKQAAVEPKIANRFASTIDLAVEDVLSAVKYVTVQHVHLHAAGQLANLCKEE